MSNSLMILHHRINCLIGKNCGSSADDKSRCESNGSTNAENNRATRSTHCGRCNNSRAGFCQFSRRYPGYRSGGVGDGCLRQALTIREINPRSNNESDDWKRLARVCEKGRRIHLELRVRALQKIPRLKSHVIGVVERLVREPGPAEGDRIRYHGFRKSRGLGEQPLALGHHGAANHY